MYHGNLAAWLAVRMCAPRPRLFWNLRQTLYDIRLESRQTRWLIRLGARLSPTADKIIYNSEVSARQHELAGYTAGKRVVIPNGFDIGIMEAQADARQSVRKEFGFAPDALLVGQVARYHPMKGHLRMLLAAASVGQKNPRARFLLVGLGVTRNNLALADQIRALGLDEKVILAGERADIARLMAAMDILVSASEWGEGFPNVVGEAMACGTPCVVTDVGDSAWVVGECGRIVPPRDADALSKTIVALLLDDGLRKELGYKARQRIQDLFSIEKVSKSYLDLYKGKLN
jgi:glycosyltransferase involved in cell wall biosynthesis